MKRKIIQKIGAVFMAICICITYMPMGVFAEEAKEISQNLQEEGDESAKYNNKSDTGQIIKKTE
ncbi:MAG: hypothetical protein RSE57_06635, partial [Clostridia bacterium]